MVRPKRLKAAAKTAVATAPVAEDDDEEQPTQEPKARRKPAERKAKVQKTSEPVESRRQQRLPGKKAATETARAAAATATAMDVDDNQVNGHELASGGGDVTIGQNPTDAGVSAVNAIPVILATSSTPMIVDEGPRKRNKKAKETDRKIKVARKRKHDRGVGQVLVCGQNDVGQLGLGESIIERSRPTFVPVADASVDDDDKIVDVCAGGMHTVCLTEDGLVYTFGCNDEGALGRDTSVDGSETKPGRVDFVGAKKIVQVSAGDSHTAALADDGRVFVCGNFRDANGAMGLVSDSKKEDRPVCLDMQDEVVKISSGSDHLVLLTKDGTVLTLGIAEHGQLGRIGERFATRDGRKGTLSMLTPTPVLYTKASYAKLVFDNVWATSHATFARVKDKNEIFATGLNNYRQLGKPTSFLLHRKTGVGN